MEMAFQAPETYQYVLDLQELLGKVAVGNYKGLAALITEIADQFDVSTGHTHDGSTSEDGPNIPAVNITVADAGDLVTATQVEAALQEAFQHIQTSQAYMPVPLSVVRELTTGAIPNATANGGVLASDTTPILNTINGDTDGCLRISWAAGNSDAIGFQVPLPPDLNTSADVVIHFRAAMEGTTDTPTIASDAYFNEGDTKVEDVSDAVTGTSYAEYTITIAAADVPSGAQTLSIELTPGAHTTDALNVTAIWIEYTRQTLTS